MISTARPLRRWATAALLGLALASAALVRPSAAQQGPQTATAAQPTATAARQPSHLSLADHRFVWPTWGQLVRVVMLRDYNTRVVMLGTLLLGTSAGLVGVFLLLRRRSLLGDVVSHASLPGIGLAFLVMEMIRGGSGKWLPGLLLGALLAGITGIVCTKLILRYTRVKEDAALAIVLSIFFGFGICLFTIIQNIPTGNAAGLNQFIFGKAASMVADDVWLIGGAALLIALLVGTLFKEFSVLCFDERFAATQGWPVFKLDLILMVLVTGVTVIGLQSVGLLLVVALMIIPAAAARFWSNNLRHMTLVAAGIGAASAYLGVVASALFPRLAAGAVIVLTGSAFFVVSMFCGLRRGIMPRLLTHRRLKRRVGRQHVLRAFFEFLEPRGEAEGDWRGRLAGRIVEVDDLMPLRSWTLHRLQQLLADAERSDLVVRISDRAYQLTQRGAEHAYQVVRNHRLWELYLIEYADIAPSHVDRDADDIEHLLGADVIGELERLLSQRYPHFTVPPSPHSIAPTVAAG